MRVKSGVVNVWSRAFTERGFSLVALGAALCWLGYVLITTFFFT